MDKKLTLKQRSMEYAKSVVRLDNPEKPTQNERWALKAVAENWADGYKAAIVDGKTTVVTSRQINVHINKAATAK